MQPEAGHDGPDPVKLRLAIAGAIALGLASSSGAQLANHLPPVLMAHPSVTGPMLPAGETSLVNGAVAYRPPNAPAGPLPLLVLLHGAGGHPPGFLQKMEPVADRLGIMLVAPHSVGQTWDLVENMAAGDDPWKGIDAHRIDQVLADLFKRSAVDPSRVVLLGFSDGASYGLSLGVSNPKLFTTVIVLSPGMWAPPRRVDRNQRVFIAHGRQDRVLPFATTSDIADTLAHAGAKVRFRPFDGGHHIDPDALTEALQWAFQGGALQQ